MTRSTKPEPEPAEDVAVDEPEDVTGRPIFPAGWDR